MEPGTTCVTISPAARPAAKSAHSITFALLTLTFVLGLALRLVPIEGAVTEDEDQWVLRSGGFARALARGAWSSTFQVGHPGVTVMWLVRLTLGEERARGFAEATREGRGVAEAPGFLGAIHETRAVFAVLGALLAAAVGALAWRLLGPGPGLLAALLAACEPYWVGMSPIVGMDALMSGLMVVSLLLAMWALEVASEVPHPRPGTRSSLLWPRARGLVLPLASGLLAGLAGLTKATAVVVAPAVALLALGYLLARRDRRALRTTALFLTAWGLGALAALPLWPAVWVGPLETLRLTAEYVARLSGTPHVQPNFFLGEPVVDPGPLFYPVVLGLRIGAATLLGVLAALAWGAPRERRGVLLALALFCVGYLAVLSLSPKKVDRYVLPAVLALEVPAGYGLWRALAWLRRWLPGVPELGLLGLGLAQLYPLAATQPYALAAYNPLVGGAKVAEQTIPVGWGEGLEVVGEWLRQQPDAASAPVAIWTPLAANFRAHAPGPIVRPSELDQAAYYVEYIHTRQRGLTPRSLQGRAPQLVVRIGGLDYARVWRLRS